MWLYVTSILIGLVILIISRKKNPEPICGIYSQPGKWFPLKFAIFYGLYSFRQWRSKCVSTRTDGQQAGYGMKSRNSVEEMEMAQPLSSHIKAFDAVFFSGANKEGYYFIISSERRPYNICNGLCYIVVPKLGLLCSPKLPDTILFGAKDDDFGAECILLTPVSAMRIWTLKYKGKMRLQSDPSKIFNVEFEAEWKSTLPYFDYDTDMHPMAVSRAFSKEKWTSTYFRNLKEAHQTHYEQMGELKGAITIDGDIHNISQMPSFRDHSYGNIRNWDLMHRYAFHHMFLQNGIKATVGVICQPCTCSMLEVGYVYTEYGDLHPVEWCDLKLYNHGENGRPPLDYGFQFKAGGRTYRVQVLVKEASTHYVGWKWEARMEEMFVEYVVNGVSGRGTSEWNYHNETGRPNTVASADPHWFDDILEEYATAK